jgi:hypothetical protein
MTRRTTRTAIASVSSITDICDLNSARATSDLLGSLTPHCGQRGASATKSWPHLRQAGRAILTPPVHGGGTVNLARQSQASVKAVRPACHRRHSSLGEPTGRWGLPDNPSTGLATFLIGTTFVFPSICARAAAGGLNGGWRAPAVVSRATLSTTPPDATPASFFFLVSAHRLTFQRASETEG